MGTSDSDSDYEMVSSQKTSETFDEVPDDKEYIIKVLGSENSKFKFQLLKGKVLPYHTVTKTRKGFGKYQKLLCIIIKLFYVYIFSI